MLHNTRNCRLVHNNITRPPYAWYMYMYIILSIYTCMHHLDDNETNCSLAGVLVQDYQEKMNIG